MLKKNFVFVNYRQSDWNSSQDFCGETGRTTGAQGRN